MLKVFHAASCAFSRCLSYDDGSWLCRGTQSSSNSGAGLVLQLKGFAHAASERRQEYAPAWRKFSRTYFSNQFCGTRCYWMSKCAVLAFVFLHISAETDEFGIHLDVCGCVKKKKKRTELWSKNWSRPGILLLPPIFFSLMFLIFVPVSTVCLWCLSMLFLIEAYRLVGILFFPPPSSFSECENGVARYCICQCYTYHTCVLCVED